ncbi:Bug family tripartite tricarboxylate transporter substrate binding protein [Variovorax ginsengisoli]|uniref:Tripartite tricarboxylate transporter substrate binding protein n=1 Tax=Variovorax ginsengisoli TaxID=363844 RepID=A0ABT8S5Y1_9BURK|nr:tripartite tricarboxylate transporter substrate binding protein [Variovorax ginsengisoli]MDN8614980.1 tripartite tricarboxylate transporter substrate binding protein [Variovorax ginsengisoli]MDO1534150.1 tripartite tricarboxylate transporter substrate binding protein [Variovorax ginsengisoli]
MKNRMRLALPLIPLVAASWARAQDGWPNRPVRLIVPFPPGGSTDAQGRLLAQKLSDLWGQPVIVDNRPGAGAVLATNVVAKAPPDGYTLGIAVSSHAINPTLRSDLPYDTLKDLQPVSEVGVQHIILDANPSLPVRNLAELLDLARRQPGSLSYASPGSGTAHHLVMELLKAKTGVNIVHVPYRGGAPAQQDVMGGQVPLLMDTYYASAGLIKAGKLKPIALFSPERPASVPDIPVVAETVAGVSGQSSIGVIAPAGTPASIVQKISADIARAARTPEFAQKLLEMGLDPVGSTPHEYDQRIRADILKWAPVIRASGAKAD